MQDFAYRIQSLRPEAKAGANVQLDIADLRAAVCDKEQFVSFDAALPLARWSVALAGDSHPFAIRFRRQSDVMHISLPLNGSIETTLGSREGVLASFGIGARMSSVTESTILRGRGGALTLVLIIPLQAASSALLEMTGKTSFGGMDPVPAMFANGLARRLLRAACYVASELADDPAPVTREMIVQSMDDVLSLLLAEMLDGAGIGVAPGPVPRIVVRAEEYMRAYARDPLSISQVARAAGTTPRNLQYVFNKFRGCPPMRYLHDVRLENVHAELLANPQGRITTIVRAWGFGNVGRFASDYRARFGHSPSETRLARSGQGLRAARSPQEFPADPDQDGGKRTASTLKAL